MNTITEFTLDLFTKYKIGNPIRIAPHIQLDILPTSTCFTFKVTEGIDGIHLTGGSYPIGNRHWKNISDLEAADKLITQAAMLGGDNDHSFLFTKHN